MIIENFSLLVVVCFLSILIGAYGFWYSPISAQRRSDLRDHELRMVSFGKYQSVKVDHDSYFQGTIWGKSWPDGIRLNNRYNNFMLRAVI